MSPDRSPTSPCAECDHAREAHEHYRPGADCGLCDCARFRDRRRSGAAPRESGKLMRILRGAGRRLGRSGR